MISDLGAIRSALVDLWQQECLMSRLGYLPWVPNCTKLSTEVMANNFEKTCLHRKLTLYHGPHESV